jgi:hypothetical protein
LFDLLLPILKDEQLLQFRLHARMLWAERRVVNRRGVQERRSLGRPQGHAGGLESAPY